MADIKNEMNGNIFIHYDLNKEKLIPYNLIFDRINSIKARISYGIGSLPRLTFYHRNESKRYEYHYNVESFNLEVENSNEFIEKMDELMKKYNIKTKKDYTLYWIYFNKSFRSKNGKLYKTIEKLKNSHNGAYETYITLRFSDEEKENYSEFEHIYNDVAEFSEKLDFEFFQLKQKIEDDDINFKKLVEFKMSKNTELEITQTILEVKFDIDVDIYEFFDKIKMSRELPFISIGNFFKIFKDFKIPDTWPIEDEEEDEEEKKNTLYMYILNTKDETEKNLYNPDSRLYSIAKLKSKHKKDEINEITMVVESRVDQELTKTELVNRILGSYNKTEENKIVNIITKELGIKGKFQIPNVILYDLIIRDLCINNSLFSNFIFIDESRQVEKIKQNIYIHFVFNSFYSDSENSENKPITASLNQLVVQPNDYNLLTNNFKIGDKYVEIKIVRAIDEQIVRQFIGAFSRLMKLYQKEIDPIINKYEHKIVNFNEYIKKEKEKIIIEKSDQKLTTIVPKIFLPKIYPRKCAQDIQPKIISNEDYKNMLEEFQLPKNYKKNKENKRPKLHALNLLQNAIKLQDKNDLLQEEAELLVDLYGDNWVDNIEKLLRIPISRNDREIFIYPRKNEIPRRYMTTSQTHPYIGIIKNSGDNKDLFKWLPCSYEIPQYKTTDNELKGEKKIKDYYGLQVKNGADINTSNTYTIKTNKYVLSKQIGESVPKNISEFLHTIDNNKDDIYYRKGVSTTISDFKNSTLESITVAMGDLLNVDDRDLFKLDPNRYFKNKRKNMLNYINEIYQTSYQYSNIKKIITTQYLSPKFFLKALEDLFDCYIFLFSRDNINPNGYLAPPFFTQEYYDYKNNIKERPYILLYEHTGTTDGDYHCEIIAKSSDWKRENEKMIFDRDDDIIVKIKEVFNTMYIKNFVINNESIIRLNNLKLPSFKKQIIGQSIDYFGKTRYLKFENDIIIYTNPLPNLLVPLFNNNELNKNLIDNKDALKFLENIDHIPVYSNNYIIGYKGNIGYIQFYLPIKSIINKEKINNDFNVIEFPNYNNEDQLEKFNLYKRLARYIVEYVFYLFSLYYKKTKNDEKKEEKMDDIIVEFANKNIIINPKFKYQHKEQKDEKNNKEVIKRIFDIKNNILLDNGKIVLPNMETLKRVLYALKLNLKNSKDEIINYSNRKYIKHYYEDINDFDQSGNFIIVSGELAVKQLILSTKINYHTTDVIKIIPIDKTEKKRIRKKKETKTEEKKDEDKEDLEEKQIRDITTRHLNTTPYLFSNSNLNKTTYIVQPVTDIKTGQYVYKTYKENGYNIGNINLDLIDSKELKDLKFNVNYSLVLYNSNMDIQVNFITKENSENNCLILIYKIKINKDTSIILYQVLLPINNL
jgi:hypothetical protein